MAVSQVTGHNQLPGLVVFSARFHWHAGSEGLWLTFLSVPWAPSQTLRTALFSQDLFPASVSSTMLETSTRTLVGLLPYVEKCYLIQDRLGLWFSKYGLGIPGSPFRASMRSLPFPVTYPNGPDFLHLQLAWHITTDWMEMLTGESSCLLGSWTLKRLAKMLNNAILLTEIFLFWKIELSLIKILTCMDLLLF